MPSSPDPAVAERRAKIVARRVRGIPARTIALELGISEDLVYQDAHRELAKRKAELDHNRDVLIAAQVEELDAVRERAWRHALMRHYQVSQSGAVAKDPETGQPLIDTGPNDRALALVIRAQERLAKLLALDEAKKIDIKAEVVTLDSFDAAIADARRQLELERIRTAGGAASTPHGMVAHSEGTRVIEGRTVPGELPS